MSFGEKVTFGVGVVGVSTLASLHSSLFTLLCLKLLVRSPRSFTPLARPDDVADEPVTNVGGCGWSCGCGPSGGLGLLMDVQVVVVVDLSRIGSFVTSD